MLQLWGCFPGAVGVTSIKTFNLCGLLGMGTARSYSTERGTGVRDRFIRRISALLSSFSGFKFTFLPNDTLVGGERSVRGHLPGCHRGRFVHLRWDRTPEGETPRAFPEPGRALPGPSQPAGLKNPKILQTRGGGEQAAVPSPAEGTRSPAAGTAANPVGPLPGAGGRTGGCSREALIARRTARGTFF